MIGAFAVASAGTLVFFGGAGGGAVPEPDGSLALGDRGGAAGVLIDHISELDSDNDGLKDWEEHLWGTDAHNADTDGDGAKDGDEVDANRDPANAGLDDSLEARPDNADTATNASQTATDAVARDAFETYFLYKQQGQPIDATNIKRIVAESIRSSLAKDVRAPAFPSEDIITTSDNSTGALRAYGNTFGAIISQSAPPNGTSSVAVLAEAVRARDETMLKELDGSIGIYDDLISEMRAVTVPGDALILHQNFMNSALAMRHMFDSMRNVFTDPVQTMAMLSSARHIADTFAETQKQIGIFLAQNGVRFQENEPGSIIQNSI